MTITRQFPPFNLEQFLHYVLHGIVLYPIQCIAAVFALWILIRIRRVFRDGITWRQPPSFIDYERPGRQFPAPGDVTLPLPSSEPTATKQEAETAVAAAKAAITAITDTSLEEGFIEQKCGELTGQDLKLLRRQLDKARRFIKEAFAANDLIMDDPRYDPALYTAYELIVKAYQSVETRAIRARKALDFALELTESI